MRKETIETVVKPGVTFMKYFMASILTQLLIELQEGHDLFTWDQQMVNKLLTAGIVSNLPVIINWLNPTYKHYGRKKQ